MSKGAIYTHIMQQDVEIVSEGEWDGYERNRPGKDWSLIRLSNGSMVWVANYSLTTPKISDFSKVRITGAGDD